MHFQKSLIFGSAIASVALAIPQKSNIFKRANIQQDCQGSQGDAINQAMQKCAEIAEKASQMILQDERYAVAYFNTDDQNTLQTISKNYKTIAENCAGGQIPIFCNDQARSCGGSTLAVTTTWTNDAKTPEIRMCPNSWEMNLPALPTKCGRDDLTSVLIHEMSHAVIKTDDLKSFKTGGTGCVDDAYSYGYYARAIDLQCLDREGEGQTGIVREDAKNLAAGAVTSGDASAPPPATEDTTNDSPPASNPAPVQNPAPVANAPPVYVSNPAPARGSFKKSGRKSRKTRVVYKTVYKTVNAAKPVAPAAPVAAAPAAADPAKPECDEDKKKKRSLNIAVKRSFDKNGFEVDDFDYKRAKRAPAPGQSVDSNGFEVDDYDY